MNPGIAIARWIAPPAALLAVLFWTADAEAQSPGPRDEPHKPKDHSYQSAETCRQCHPGIHKLWSGSMHAQGISDPVFQVAYARAITLHGVGIRSFCLSCHSPTTRITGDIDMKEPVSKEAITCDFCHTVTNVIEGKPRNGFEVQLGDTKYGPIDNIPPISGLSFKYSALHGSSKLCSGCHELESENGVSIIGTYSEWKKSPYAAKGIQCQNCHMPETLDVPVVSQDVSESPRKAHSHDFQGGHSKIKLEKAATLTVSTKREGKRILVDAFVTNEEAGHYLPTGLPTRQIVLTVEARNAGGKVLATQERRYEKVLADKEKHPLLTAECTMTQAASVLSDTRLAPKETRHEQFEFKDIPAHESIVIAADLRYKLEVAVLQHDIMTVAMVGATSSLPAAEGAEIPAKWIVVGLVLAGILVIVIFGVKHRRVSRNG